MVFMSYDKLLPRHCRKQHRFAINVIASIFIDRTALDLRYLMKQTQSNHANVK